jgi:hypothetical protein
MKAKPMQLKITDDRAAAIMVGYSKRLLMTFIFTGLSTATAVPSAVERCKLL